MRQHVSYRPHRYFFTHDSPWFASYICTATIKALDEAVPDIVLNGITTEYFDAFLSILYPVYDHVLVFGVYDAHSSVSRFHLQVPKTQKQWASVLKLAHMRLGHRTSFLVPGRIGCPVPPSGRFVNTFSLSLRQTEHRPWDANHVSFCSDS